MQAAHSSINSEGTVCQTDLSPPSNRQRDCRSVANATTSQPQAPATAAQSDAGEPDDGEPDDVYPSREGEQ